jgi:alpha(1,3/1,4) fucosyltransferase
MKIISLIIAGMRQDEIFDLNCKLNRDNGFLAWHLLKLAFLNQKFEIHTADLISNEHVDCEIHLDSWQKVTKGVQAYLLMLETSQVCAANGIPSNLVNYRKIFTWNDDLVDGIRFIKFNFPNPIQVHPEDGFEHRDRFCCLISSNRVLAVQDARILYPERVKVIRWFEKNAPQDFDLYGVDWNMPVLCGNIFGKIERRFWRIFGRFVNYKPFPSYRGKVAHKREVLEHTRFAICYENVRDLPGYITEKIFDCFFSGCVPVYWGASNITDHIPADCFIDRRKFNDTAGVYAFLKAMSEDEYRGYQQRIAAFLQSEAAYPFSSEFFAETIVNTIVQDLGT